jgi:hypothetical protein
MLHVSQAHFNIFPSCLPSWTIFSPVFPFSHHGYFHLISIQSIYSSFQRFHPFYFQTPPPPWSSGGGTGQYPPPPPVKRRLWNDPLSAASATAGWCWTTSTDWAGWTRSNPASWVLTNSSLWLVSGATFLPVKPGRKIRIYPVTGALGQKIGFLQTENGGGGGKKK